MMPSPMPEPTKALRVRQSEALSSVVSTAECAFRSDLVYNERHESRGPLLVYADSTGSPRKKKACPVHGSHHGGQSRALQRKRVSAPPPSPSEDQPEPWSASQGGPVCQKREITSSTKSAASNYVPQTFLTPPDDDHLARLTHWVQTVRKRPSPALHLNLDKSNKYKVGRGPRSPICGSPVRKTRRVRSPLASNTFVAPVPTPMPISPPAPTPPSSVPANLPSEPSPLEVDEGPFSYKAYLKREEQARAAYVEIDRKGWMEALEGVDSWADPNEL